MTTDEFWNIIELAREHGDDCDTVVSAVRHALNELSLEALLGFNRELDQRMAESYRWDLWAVAYIVNGGCSDDSFDYFRGWLITKGRAYYEAAMQDATRAADAARFDENECEDMIAVAASVYEERAGDYPPDSDVERPGDPIGKQWDEDELDSLYPELTKRFP